MRVIIQPTRGVLRTSFEKFFADKKYNLIDGEKNPAAVVSCSI